MQFLDLIMIQILTWLMSTIMQCMCHDRWRLPNMADVLKILVLFTQNTGHIQNKHDSNESRICKSQWRGWNTPLNSERDCGSPELFWINCNGVQQYGITTIFSTPGIPVLKRQWKLQYTGNWKGMRNTIWSITKSCKTCQVNKKNMKVWTSSI